MRPTIRRSFLVGERRPVVHFYTSSDEKFLQARLVFERNGLSLSQFRTKRDPYQEDYSLSKQHLLERALKEIKTTVGHGSLFFVEDTSVRIEALSDAADDQPGLGFKEWFASTSFADVDALLRQRGSDRRAIVKSDIALNVPGLPRPVFFHGETNGEIGGSAPAFKPQVQYPWLTPETFNGWFVPDGADRRLGEMDLEESWGYDFRVRALTQLIDRLEEYAVVMNAQPPAYTRRPRASAPGNARLFEPEEPAFCVIGPTCAGKTTFGLRAEQLGWRFIEASSVVRTFQEDSVVDEDIGAYELAKRVLYEHGADIVARRIFELYEADLDNPIVITGFRTLEELIALRSRVPRTRVIFVDATERTRFERYVRRSRPDSKQRMDEFRQLDRQQAEFGLLQVSRYVADLVIRNEGTYDEYIQQIDAVVQGVPVDRIPGVVSSRRMREAAEASQLLRCLLTLDRAGHPLSTDEIEAATRAEGAPIRHNNANKVLKKVPGLARRLDSGGPRVRYEIENAGRAYIRLLQEQTGQTTSPIDSAQPHPSAKPTTPPALPR